MTKCQVLGRIVDFTSLRAVYYDQEDLDKVEGKVILLHKLSMSTHTLYHTPMIKYTDGEHVKLFSSEIQELTFVDIWEMKRAGNYPRPCI